MGNITKALLNYQPHANYCIIDNSNKMLDLAESNLPMFSVDVDCWDILAEYPKSFNIIHSHGVLEHFEDEQKDAMRQQEEGGDYEGHIFSSIEEVDNWVTFIKTGNHKVL